MEKQHTHQSAGHESASTGCISRRSLLKGTAAASTVLLTGVPGLQGEALAAEMARYPRMVIGKLSALRKNKPVEFNYPDKKQNSDSVLVKLGVPAGGGIGPDRDVVAFNSLCTHMGGIMTQTYKPADQVLGPCPFHQSSFDLTRHGMIIAGHATESLPQILLELKGDDIIAVGLIGLIYGRHDNLKA